MALERAASRALEAGPDVAGRIAWLHADFTEWVPVAASYNLVSAQFLHLPGDQRELIYRRIAESVTPGGVLLVVGHHPSDLHTNVRRPRVPDLLFTASEVGASLSPEDWIVLVDEARPRQTLDPDGQAATVHDAVLKAQRAN